MRSRLLSGIYNGGIHRLLICSCRSRADLARDVCHPATCLLNNGITVERHDAVRDKLARFIKCMRPNAVVVMEPNQIAGHRQGNPKRPDILVDEGARSYAIDVSIVEPAAQSRMQHATLSSLNTPGGAAIQEEEAKKLEYRGGAHFATLVPFVVESTGRLGPAALAFMNRVSGDAAGKRGKFLLELSVILARAMGRYSVHTRSRLLPTGGNQ